MGHAPSPQTEDPARLGPGRNDQVLGAVEGLELDVGAERGLAHRQVQHVREVVPVALKTRMGADRQVHVQIAGRASTGSGRPPTGEAQGRAVVHACGHVHRVAPLFGPTPFSPAVSARISDDPTQSTTARAGRGRDHLAEDRLTHAPDLASASTLRTDSR